MAQGQFSCAACERTYDFSDDVFFAKENKSTHYFDSVHEVMQTGNESLAISTLCYSQQSSLASKLIRPGNVIVDIGCGPTVHYERPQDSVLIGIDPSFNSIRSNTKLDIKVFGNAEATPLPDKSVDNIFFFYSIHHMIGQTVKENTANLTAALHECNRMIRKQGSIIIFDMSPWWPAWQLQCLSWNQARGVLADKLDMFFWRKSALKKLADPILSAREFTSCTFQVSPFLTFPPIFSIPSLKFPRFLYPFDVNMYHWQF